MTDASTLIFTRRNDSQTRLTVRLRMNWNIDMGGCLRGALVPLLARLCPPQGGFRSSAAAALGRTPQALRRVGAAGQGIMGLLTTLVWLGCPVLAATPPAGDAPRVTLEVRLVGITAPDEAALRLDWMWRDVRLPLIDTNTVTGSNILLAVTEVVSDPQFRQLIQTLDQPATNVVRELRGDEFGWGGRQVTNASNIRLSAVQGLAHAGILTEPQCFLVLRALEQRQAVGVEVLSTPRVVASSGQPTRIQMAQSIEVLTGINPEALVQSGRWGRTNLSAFTTAQVPVGPMLEVLPVVSTNGTRLELTLTSTLTEFVGYDPPPKEARVRVWQKGVKKQVAAPMPRFLVLQSRAKLNVQDGQTIIFATSPIPTADGANGDKPVSTRTSRTKTRRVGYQRLLVFVRPIIVKPTDSPWRALTPGESISRTNSPSAPRF